MKGLPEEGDEIQIHGAWFEVFEVEEVDNYTVKIALEGSEMGDAAGLSVDIKITGDLPLSRFFAHK